MPVKCINCTKNMGTYCEDDMWFEGDGDVLTDAEIQDQINAEIFCSQYEHHQPDRPEPAHAAVDCILQGSQGPWGTGVL